MNLGGAIDQHINAMGIDDDPVSTIDLSALNQLFNNVLAPTFNPQQSTSTQQLPPMLLRRDRFYVLHQFEIVLRIHRFCKTRSVVKRRSDEIRLWRRRRRRGVASGIPSTAVAESSDIATSSEVAIGV
jgi:hypothetical protein